MISISALSRMGYLVVVFVARPEMLRDRVSSATIPKQLFSTPYPVLRYPSEIETFIWSISRHRVPYHNLLPSPELVLNRAKSTDVLAFVFG